MSPEKRTLSFVLNFPKYTRVGESSYSC